MKTYNFNILNILLLITVLCSCTSRQERNKQRAEIQQNLMTEHVNTRRANFIKNHESKCKREFYSKAISIVDSILLVDARKRLDTIPKPSKVERPDKPEILEFIDSSELKPLFDSLSFSPQPQTTDSTEVLQQGLGL